MRVRDRGRVSECPYESRKRLCMRVPNRQLDHVRVCVCERERERDV